MRRDFDSPWKTILELFLPQFLELFFPAIHRDIHWGSRPVFLDGELHEVLPRGALGRRSVDRLIKVRLRRGRVVWILIHIEIQERSQRGFSRRMYIVSYRIFDRFDRHAVSVALHTGRGSWRSRPYDFRRWGFRVQLRYPVATLAPFRADPSALETSENPVAVLVLAHLASQEGGSPEARYQKKLRLMDIVHRRKGRRRWPKNGIMRMRRFMDWFLPLPEHLERRLARELVRRFGEQHMAFMTIWERDGWKRGRKEGLAIGVEQGVQKGIDRGVKQGRHEEIRTAIREAVRARFGKGHDVLLRRIERIEGLPRLRAIHRAVVTADTFQDLEARIPANGRRPTTRGPRRRRTA